VDNEDYLPGDQFDAEDEWISESEYMICNLYAQSSSDRKGARILRRRLARQIQEKEKGIKGQTLRIHGQNTPAILWITTSSSADLGHWVEWLKEIEKGPKQSPGRIRPPTKSIAIRRKHRC
jgi:hypothetical protein